MADEAERPKRVDIGVSGGQVVGVRMAEGA